MKLLSCFLFLAFVTTSSADAETSSAAPGMTTVCSVLRSKTNLAAFATIDNPANADDAGANAGGTGNGPRHQTTASLDCHTVRSEAPVDGTGSNPVRPNKLPLVFDVPTVVAFVR